MTSLETTIILKESAEFHIKSIKYKNLGKYDNLDLIEVQENEYRKDDFLFYSQIIKYRLLGYLLPNNEHSLRNYFSCTGCFYKIDNYEKCNICELDFSKSKTPFFLNCNYFTQYKLYEKYRKKYELGIFEEFLRDQRTKICNPIKFQIIEKALHPNKIMRILELTNGDLENLENYI